MINDCNQHEKFDSFILHEVLGMLKRYSTISACRPVKCADWPTVEEIDQLLTCGGRNRLLQMQMGLFISLSLPDPLTFPPHFLRIIKRTLSYLYYPVLTISFHIPFSCSRQATYFCGINLNE